MPDPVLSTRELNRALLARQLLLERSSLSIADAVEQIGGLQTQYAPSGYVGLWTRVAGFRRADLTAAIEAREIIQATLMRSTIHLVSRREFWRYALGVRQARRTWSLRVHALATTEATMVAGAAVIRDVLAGGPRNVKELDGPATGLALGSSLWVDLVRVPPSGTWERRRADLMGLAEDWVGLVDATEDEGLAHLVRAYLRAFGPAPWRDISLWAGIPVGAVQRGGESLALVRYRDEAGRELLDLPDAPLPDPETPAPVRFLPHWDATLLVHARRTGLLAEEHRPKIFTSRNPFSVGTYLVDGQIVGAWSLREGQIVLDPFEVLTGDEDAAVEVERAALEAFHR